MAQYLLAVVYDPLAGPEMSAAEAEAAFAAVDALNKDLMSNGKFVSAAGLMPASEAVTVSADGTLEDGPVRAGGAQLGGYWVVAVENRSEAEALAVRAAAACGRDIELREMQS